MCYSRGMARQHRHEGHDHRPVRKTANDAMSARKGICAQPKDFDWLDRNVPCRAACPAHTDVPAYLEAVASGRFDEAYRLNLRDNVFPAVLGRVCTRPCEPACRHGWEGLGEPVAICFSKRSAADFMSRGEPVVADRLFPDTGKRVAVIGAGPAGLAAARDLALLGHVVVVHERAAAPGGMMVQGIPAFRLPRPLVAREIDQVIHCGVTMRCGEEIDAAKLAALRKANDAVVIATGATKPNRPDIPGADRPGVWHGLDFLRRANAGDAPAVGRRVVVIGGGFTSVDCARMARRLGAESVRMLYRRSRGEMYITPGEVEEMEAEGISFETHWGPVEFLGESDLVSGVRFVRMKPGTTVADGRREYEPVPGDTMEVPADTVLLGTGQTPERGWFDTATNEPGVFVAGDVATGARSLIEAVAQGRAAARRVDLFLTGRERLAERVRIEDVETTGRTRAMDAIPRQPMPVLPVAARGVSDEVETGLAREAAMTEASRCYLCNLKFEIDNDLCIYCDRCLKVKPVEKCIVKLESLIHDAQGRITGYREARSAGEYRMLYIDQAQCIRCGACKDVCPVECITLQRVTGVEVNTGGRT